MQPFENPRPRAWSPTAPDPLLRGEFSVKAGEQQKLRYLISLVNDQSSVRGSDQNFYAACVVRINDSGDNNETLQGS